MREKPRKRPRVPPSPATWGLNNIKEQNISLISAVCVCVCLSICVFVTVHWLCIFVYVSVYVSVYLSVAPERKGERWAPPAQQECLRRQAIVLPWDIMAMTSVKSCSNRNLRKFIILNINRICWPGSVHLHCSKAKTSFQSPLKWQIWGQFHWVYIIVRIVIIFIQHNWRYSR